MTVERRLPLELERHRLRNGLDVVLHRDLRLPLVAVNLWYHVGSKDERPGRTGLAHLFEHMLFQGSEHLGTNDHFLYVQQAGGVANGSTWYDRTNYYETLPAHRFELGLWLESDRLGFLLPALTAEKLETQRQVVMNERRQRVDNQPYGRAFERLNEILYRPDHPYHWPVIGYMDDIAAATLDEVQAFFRTHYTPNNAVLTVAGHFEPAAVLERIDAYFGDIPRGPEPPAVSADLEPLGGSRQETLHDDVQLPRVYVAFRVPGFGDPGWYAADLLSSIWSAGRSSVLYQDLVYRKEIAQDVSSFVLPTELAATVAVTATARPGVSATDLLEELTAHLDRSTVEPVAPADFERARNRILTDYFNEFERLDSRADLLSQFTTFFDDPERAADEPARYLEVTPEELLRFAARFAEADERATVRVLPRERA